MFKSEMYILRRPRMTPSRSRTILATILLMICVPIFFYQLVPAFTRSVDSVIESVIVHLRESHCTAEIGDGHCCALFMEATPCVEECRKKFVDRETFTLTLEYDECADTCLHGWEGCNGAQEKEQTT
ncbi:uncharacterized protein EKO05_0007763 [Ascochyta rabiei]|uniref:uncharacterized protein n=1 Tax=Didymella rabiei TaxID=5454 RepID=UPI00220B23C4|nr:uncharacterized protein EKO05_0007763 [Ascochyta rabiei]UPX17404.1 hypothetical protein EKO05_0007763 [Ascochyta rabiei]